MNCWIPRPPLVSPWVAPGINCVHVAAWTMVVAVLASPAIGGQIYDPLSDWNPSANTTAGTWQYGTSTTLSGPMSLFPFHDAQTTAPTYDWWSFDGVFVGPVIGLNNSASTITISAGPDLIWPADQLLMAPGGKFGTPAHVVLRWVAPETGLYQIAGAFSDLQQASVDVNVLVNGSSVFAGGYSGDSPYQGERPFDLSSVVVAQDQTVDFVVSSGGNDGNDVLGIVARIAVVPEPSCTMLAAVGLIALAALRGRLRSKGSS